MIMIEEMRVSLLLVTFGVLAWFDFKEREINVLVFIIPGGIGCILYIFDWQDIMTIKTLYLSVGVAIVVAIPWRIGLFGMGDLLAIYVGLITYPAHHGTMPVVLPVFIGGFILSLVCMLMWNIMLNMLDYIQYGKLFSDVVDARTRKVMAFFLVHHRRKFEKHVFVAEEKVVNVNDNNMKDRQIICKLNLGIKVLDQKFAPAIQQEQNADKPVSRYVESACPLMVFMAISAFMVILILPWMHQA